MGSYQDANRLNQEVSLFQGKQRQGSRAADRNMPYLQWNQLKVLLRLLLCPSPLPCSFSSDCHYYNYARRRPRQGIGILLEGFKQVFLKFKSTISLQSPQRTNDVAEEDSPQILMASHFNYLLVRLVPGANPLRQRPADGCEAEGAVFAVQSLWGKSSSSSPLYRAASRRGGLIFWQASHEPWG